MPLSPFVRDPTTTSSTIVKVTMAIATDAFSLALLALAGSAVYCLALTLYRLLLHPLSAFPGPRLAAVTSWYEAYYEIVLNGQYSNKISQLHDQYGTIHATWQPGLCILTSL